jgi:hypothetical protein
MGVVTKVNCGHWENLFVAEPDFPVINLRYCPEVPGKMTDLLQAEVGCGVRPGLVVVGHSSALTSADPDRDVAQLPCGNLQVTPFLGEAWRRLAT